tara:strand:- start:959 stop:1438 length:480 start_codon:yes stop_codon:yes gene_type:complete
MENSEQKIKIRKANYEDLESICDIYTEAFEGKTSPSNRQWWNILDNPNIHYYVAEEGGFVVGVASLITINKLIRGGNRVALIEDVAVSKRAGSRGLGRLLIEKLKDVSVERGCYKTILNCSEDVVGFYEKCGFYQKEVQMRWDRPEEFSPSKMRNNKLF